MHSNRQVNLVRSFSLLLLLIAIVSCVLVKNVDCFSGRRLQIIDVGGNFDDNDDNEAENNNLISRHEFERNLPQYEDEQRQLAGNAQVVGQLQLEPLVEFGGAVPLRAASYDVVGTDDVSNLRRQQQQQEPKSEIYLLEDKDYPKSLFEDYSGKVGQVSGITTLPSGDVAIFHRAERQWTNETFNETTKVVSGAALAQENLIKNDTVMIIDREDGSSVTSFGSSLFYLPHSIASDNLGNLWVSDVGRHQVMRLPTSMMRDLDANEAVSHGHNKRRLPFPGNLSQIWPDIILGEAFVPGNDEAHFCQPSELAVDSQGQLLFVADGYCNKRIVVFTNRGRYLTSFGSEQNMNVVHSLALIEERNLLCVADRENARILCFRAGLDGNLNSIGELIVSIRYPLGRVFALTSIGQDHLLVSSNQIGTKRYDLAILNPFNKELKLVWTSSDLLEPHSLARTRDGQYAYAADLSREAYKKVFKFNIIQLSNSNK